MLSAVLSDHKLHIMAAFLWDMERTLHYWLAGFWFHGGNGVLRYKTFNRSTRRIGYQYIDTTVTSCNMHFE